MAKEGIDAFLLNCRSDDDLSELEAEFGIKGFAIIVRLWQKIHNEKGYYCEWIERSPSLFLSNWFGGNSGVDINLIKEVIHKAVKIGIFSEELFNAYSILTSSAIQERYLCAVKRRKQIVFIEEYLLISVGNFKGNVRIIKKNVYRNQENVDVIRTSKVKESKVKKNNIPPASEESSYQFGEGSFEIRCVDKIVASCLEQFPKSKVPLTIADKQKWASVIEKMKRLDNLTEEEILQGLDYAITDTFWKSNIRSTGKFREKFETLYLQSKSKTGKKNNFNNFQGRNYNMEELEKALTN